MTELKNIPFFFIVGRPRSGTTLLRMLFDANPLVCIPPECQFIINLYPKYGKAKFRDKKQINKFFDDLQNEWLFKTWNIDKNKLITELQNQRGKISYNEICKIVYLNYQSIFSKKETKFLGDKNPGYTIYTKKLTNIFPNSKFIHIVRDYRDHFVSIKNVDLELPNISLAVYKWRLYVKQFRKMMKKHPDNYIEIKYEDLVSNPEKEMKKLCSFTGIPFFSEMLNFNQKKGETEKIYPKKLFNRLHSSLFEKINTNKIGVYKKQLSSRSIKIADATAGKYAEKTGYKREYKRVSVWIKIIAVPGIMLALSLHYLTKIVNLFPYKLREMILSKWPLMLTKFYLKIFDPKKLTGITDF